MNIHDVEPLILTDNELTTSENVKKHILSKISNSFYKDPMDVRAKVVFDILASDFGDLDEKIKKRVLVDIAGYGLIDQLMEDDEIEEVMVNAKNRVFIFHRKKNMCKTNIVFESEEELMKLIAQLERFCGQKIDPAFPLFDGALSDGSRINITLPPCSTEPSVTIRKFKQNPLTVVDLINVKSITSEAAGFLWLCIEGMGVSPMNMIIAGGTGTGKTTLLNCLLIFTPQSERIITVEDTLELNLDYHENWVRLSTAKIGKQEIKMENLVVNTLRQRPDRICLGEVRGPEAQHLLVAMDLGHTAAGTLHANDAKEVILRLKSPPMSVPVPLISMLNLIVISKRFHHNGKFVRKITKISEVGNLEGETVLLGDSFVWDPEKETLVMKAYPVQIRDEMSKKTGLSAQEIMAESEDRAAVLEWMAKNNVHNQGDVLQVVEAYYINKKVLMQKLNLKIKGPA